MTETQVWYRLRNQGYRLRKRNNCFMIIEPERNYVVAGGEGNGLSLSMEEVVEFLPA